MMSNDWKVSVHADTPSASIDLCRVQWPTPCELARTEERPTLILSLSPSLGPKEGRYGDVHNLEFLPLGDILFHPAATRLHTRGPGGDQAFLRIAFRTENISDFTVDPQDSRMQRAMLNVRGPEIVGSLRRLAQEIARPGMATAFVLDGLTTLLAGDLARTINRLSSEDDILKGGLAGWQLTRLRERIAEVNMPPPTISELAALVRRSPRHVGRAWRTSTGTTLSEAVEDARQARAEAMIKEGSRQLKEIAYLLGFSNQSSFSTAFRRRAGISPQEFAQQSSTCGHRFAS